ncbi:uncharacterized protein LOC130696351 isoform X2 [Daphnia carinata]|uniref:uncharacterized protein LOC130696351 isoform X2 n=1 Tax=Daphnia carinata TaxID=120202 RepID=UPI00257F3136|nr:uncharacterized protein LOC130696351 isoform X2 [Daphnia carinata]
MMPNGGNFNPWVGQWYNPAAALRSDQVQGMVDVNAFHIIASQQLSAQYGSGVLPVASIWNAAASQSQWMQPWQSNFQANVGSSIALNAQPPQLPPPVNTVIAPQIPPPQQQEDASSNSNANVLSEEEKNFDIQFKEWETKFQIWKDENINHPDKKALAVYEAQWKTWREQLIQNREKLRRQREESVAKQNQLIAQLKHVGASASQPARQMTQAIRNNGIREDLQHRSNSHLQSNMPNLSGQPVILTSHHSSFSRKAPNSSTHLHAAENSKLHIPQHYQNTEDGERHSSAKSKNPSLDSSQQDRLDHVAPHYHEEFRDERVLHSTGDLHSHRMDNQPHRLPFRSPEPPQKQLCSPHLKSGQHPPGSEFEDARQRQSDVPSLRPQNRDYHRQDIHHIQPVLPLNQREPIVPRGLHPTTRETLEPPRNLLNFLSPERNNDEDLRNFPSDSSAETAANLFRKRAMRGKTDGQRFVPYKAPGLPPHLDKRAMEETALGFDGGVRPRYEARLAEHGENKISALPKPLPMELGAPPLKVNSRVLEPLVFEYNHRPGKRGRFAEPITIEYSHTKPSEIESFKTDIASCKMKTEPSAKSENVTPVEKSVPEIVPVEKSPIKPTPLPLFPSAAAIQLQENPFPKPQSQLLSDKATEGLVALQQKMAETTPSKLDVAVAPVEMEVVMVEDLLLPPGRYGRPPRIVVVLRGLPGSGKSHLARLIKEKEMAMGGPAPRILSIDDYYLLDEGTSPVPWQEDQEERYRQSLLKSLKKNLDDGHFPFIIVDALHVKVSDIFDVYDAARSRTFAVFLIDLPEVPNRTGTNRKCTDKDVEKMKSEWQQAPGSELPLPRLDIRWLLQEIDEERIPTPDDVVTSTTVPVDEDPHGSPNETPAVSKWETMEQTEEKLDRLDGIIKRKLDKPASMEDWLQPGLPDDYSDRKCIEGKKRVRWADVEEKMQQKKMRDLGFVVGQTDWSRMTDPTFGESALTKTKYI